MPIRWDPLLAAATARTLSGALGGARTRALLLDGSARRVLLFLREGTLSLELHPLAGWITLLPAAETLPEARPLAARLRGVRTLADEGSLILELERVRGGDEGLELVIELSGNRWNALVIGAKSGTIRHVLVPREGGRRPQLPGLPYAPPPSTGRLGADRPPTDSEWATLLSGLRSLDAESRARTLLRNLAWTSSLNVRELEGADLRERWTGMTDPARWSAFVVSTDRGAQPYPIPLAGWPSTAADDLLDAFRSARAAEPDAEPDATLLIPTEVLGRASGHVRKLRSRLDSLRRRLADTGDPATERSIGDLLLARFHEIPAGASTVRLLDFEGAPVDVALDPALPVQKNAARHYDRAGRMERARAELPGWIDEAEAEVFEWETLISTVHSGTLPWPELERRLGLVGQEAQRPGQGQRPGSGPTLPYHRFRSSGGLEIRVGKGARHNDALTFRNSAPDDIWLHARQAAGAHVILRWGRRDEGPPRRDLLEAAALAALNSNARHSGTVPVDWTRRKHVRKPRKSAPGSVLPERVETVFVEPDPDLPRRLSPGKRPSPP